MQMQEMPPDLFDLDAQNGVHEEAEDPDVRVPGTCPSRGFVFVLWSFLAHAGHIANIHSWLARDHTAVSVVVVAVWLQKKTVTKWCSKTRNILRMTWM